MVIAIVNDLTVLSVISGFRFLPVSVPRKVVTTNFQAGPFICLIVFSSTTITSVTLEGMSFVWTVGPILQNYVEYRSAKFGTD